MYEIDVAAIETDDRNFHIGKEAILDRYKRIFAQHSPGGQLVRLRDVPQRMAVAGSYTPIVLSHTQTAAGAFRSGLYASGFALVRPTLEALFKQYMLDEYDGDDDRWKKIPNRKVNVNLSSLRELSTRSGCPDITPFWKDLSPVLNDFVHGGKGQLTSNPINDQGWPQYPGAWFWTSMLVITICALATSGWFWAHIGHEESCQAILDTLAGEDWGTLTVMRNGQQVRIVARRT